LEKGGKPMQFEKVRAIIAKQLDIPEENITEETRLIDDLKADSLDVVELIMDLEQEFNVEIPDDELPNIRTVADILGYIAK
jgi:acyl carrier protein